MWRRRRAWRVGALAGLAAVALVAAYSINARLPPLDKTSYTTAPFFAPKPPANR
jgi:hypothetical protein